MKEQIIVWAILSFGYIFCSCVNPNRNEKNVKPAPFEIAYDFDTPDQVIKLVPELDEISGLSDWDEDYLAAVQDENGIIYKIKKTDGSIVERYEFAGNGDYEGIEITGQNIFVVKSKGDLYKIGLNELGVSDATVFETKLNSSNDCEGLAYSTIDQKLLIALKGEPGTSQNNVSEGRAIYGFDPTTLSLDKNPMFIISSSEILDLPTPKEGKKKNISEFAPSGIAVHPITNEIYVLAHKGKLLLLLDSQFVPLGYKVLNKDIFTQPEGITIASNGDIYISNEIDKGNEAILLKFDYRP